MIKLSFVPSVKSPIHELADYVEILCLMNGGQVSLEEIKSLLGMLKEEDHTDGVSEEDEAEPVIDSLFNEIERRQIFCNSGYPFTIGNNGYTISLEEGSNETKMKVYIFMLFATRINMKDNRIQNGYDGTFIFEELSEKVAANYFGERAESFLFGTSGSTVSFQQKVQELIERMGEGVEFSSSENTNSSVQKDGTLDLVTWKSFNDSSYGKIIGFGQCKTGHNWKAELEKLNPNNFCKKWFKQMPTVDPVRLFFIAEGVSRDRWYELVTSGGILFDRFRIIDFLTDLNDELFNKITNWNKSVLENINL